MNYHKLGDVKTGWLYEQYVVRRRSTNAIAADLRCSGTAVSYQLHVRGISVRSSREVGGMNGRKDVEFVNVDGCHVCTSHVNKVRGYPEVRIHGVRWRLSRYIYATVHGLERGALDGLVVMHTCDDPRCINPDHLVLGTDGANMADRDAKGRGAYGERHYRSILTEDDVRAIKMSHETSDVLGMRYGVSPATVRNVRLRRSWQHVS